jgi:hypothetical protein
VTLCIGGGQGIAIYASLAFGQATRAAGIGQSMGSRGDC